MVQIHPAASNNLRKTMQLTLNFITGIMFGMEYVEQEDEDGPFKTLVFDLFFVRICFMWE